ncbi:MAG: radical SAM protein, partial [Pseudolabrys sp.]
AIIDHGEGAIDCVLKGEGEAGIVTLMEAVAGDRAAVAQSPGAVAADGEGPPPRFIHHLDDFRPNRDLLRHRRKYFIGILDPAASIEFSRGCPWDCSFCSAWTFYGRSYRLVSPERVVEDLMSIREPGVFIVDDVAFIHAKHGFAIGEAIARKGIRKKYYLETRGDVLLRNKEVFRFWKSIGLEYMFLGIEAIDEEGLRKFRKRVSVSKNLEALEFARSLGIEVAINIIADPDWGEERFATIRMVHGGARDSHYQHQHAVSRHGELVDRGATPLHARLPAVRYSARGTPNRATAAGVLPGAA